MRKIVRPRDSEPSDLAEKAKKEMDEAEAFFKLSLAERENEKKVSFKVYKLASIKLQLEKMFGGKCAYCESFYSSTAPVDIEHYRPKGQVQEDPDHDGYWFVAADWENLLPSCIDCNRKRKQMTPKPEANLLAMVECGKGAVLTNTGKKDSFPLAEGSPRATSKAQLASEVPLLVNPCIDEPEDFLDFSYDEEVGAAIVFPRSASGGRVLNPAGTGIGGEEVIAAARASQADLAGAVSIHVYGLNRLGLVQARTRVIRRLEFLKSLFVKLDGTVDEVRRATRSTRAREIVGKVVDDMQDMILQEMRDAAHPSQEYSATARAWVHNFVTETEGVGSS